MNKYIVSFACSLSVLGAVGQTADHCVAFSIGKPKEQATLTAENLRTLELKCTQVVTRSNAAKTALYSAFVITPSLDLLGDRQVMAGTADITVLEAELTLVAENAIDGSKYGSVTIKLEGSGNSRARAINSLVQSIQPTSGAFVNFIKKATAQIIDYYSNNMGRVLTQAQNLMAAERYDDALNFLNSVPICVPAFEQSADAIAGLIKMVADKNCNAAVVMARRYMSIGDYTNAQEVLLGVKPGSSCDGDIQALLGQIKLGQDSIVAIAPAATIVPPMVTAPAVPATAEPVAVPTAAAEPVRAPKTESDAKVTNPFKTITVKVVECKGYKADNTVEVVLLVANVSDQRLEISYHFSGPTLYTENGDAVSGAVKYPTTFQLPSELTQKSTLVFNKVGTSNKTAAVSMAVHVGSENKTIDMRNLTIDWQ